MLVKAMFNLGIVKSYKSERVSIHTFAAEQNMNFLNWNLNFNVFEIVKRHSVGGHIDEATNIGCQ